jgi:DNA-binding CsgD family transcriptional regulator
MRRFPLTSFEWRPNLAMVEFSLSTLNAAAADFFIEATACKTAEALDAQFQRFVRRLGFESAMFINLSSGGAPVVPRIIFGAADSWIAHYAENNYARLDPTIQRAFRSRKAFTWRDVERPDGPREQRAFFGEAREVWAQDSLIVPVHGPFGEFSVVNLISQAPLSLTDEALALLQGACHVYATVGLNFASGPLSGPSSPMPELGRRERQCTYWMAMGKHDNETAAILKISINTVRGYLDSAKLKLGAQSRPELTLKALVYGVLVPDSGMIG